ncbi:TPT domain-containing protein [Psidium guajava]|nr:TPT domain-containing protein [Psidium guajava]
MDHPEVRCHREIREHDNQFIWHFTVDSCFLVLAHHIAPRILHPSCECKEQDIKSEDTNVIASQKLAYLG